jgi:hypothetical protein
MDLRNHEKMREDMEMLVRTYQHQGQLQEANDITMRFLRSKNKYLATRNLELFEPWKCSL